LREGRNIIVPDRNRTECAGVGGGGGGGSARKRGEEALMTFEMEACQAEQEKTAWFDQRDKD